MMSAADRVQAFLDQRQQMRGLDKDEVISANGYGFSEADLQELVDIARKSEGGDAALALGPASEEAEPEVWCREHGPDCPFGCIR